MEATNTLKIAVALRHFSPSGGLELYALKVVQGLLQDGHRVSVICERDDSKFTHDNLQVHTFAPPNKAASKADKLDYYCRTASALVQKLIAEQGPFDLIHSHHFPVSPVDVVTFHNHTTGRLSQVGHDWEKALNQAKMTFTSAYQARQKYDRQLTREAKMRIFVGAVMKDDFYQSFDMPEDAPYAIAYPGSDMGSGLEGMVPALIADPGANLGTDLGANSDDAESNGGDQKPFKFLFVGKGFRKKGLDTLLGSCAILKSRGHNFKLEIAGIKNRATGRLQLRLLNLADTVSYLGFRSDMANVFAQCQAIILPSKIEPFGMAPIEGMHYGLVPIVSKVCGVAEVLKDGEDSLILQNHLDSKELADLMERLIIDRELYNRLRAKAREAANKLNWQKTVEATEEAYRRIL